MKFKSVVNISDFNIDDLDLSEILKFGKILPKNGVIDANIAEKYLIVTIEAQDLCQEKIAQVDKFIAFKKIMLDKVEAESALIRAKDAGHKTAKEKEWFVQSDEQVIVVKGELETAKVCKIWLENKVKYFSMWHYSLKSYMRRDYGIESASGYSTFASTPSYAELELPKTKKNLKLEDEDFCGEIEWK